MSSIRPRAADVQVTEDELRVRLVDGRTISVPLAWFPTLLAGSAEDRSSWTMLGDGEGIHWPDLDEDVSVAGLLRGVPSYLVRTDATRVGAA